MSAPTTPTHGRTGLLGQFADVLAAREAEQHAAGWDNTPNTLYAVCNPGGELVTYPYRLGMLGKVFGVDLHPRDELNVLADAFTAGGAIAGAMFAQITQTKPIGWLLVMEAWKHQRHIPREVGESGEASVQRWRDEFIEEHKGKGLADIIGSVEMRCGLGLIGTHWLYLDRVRGRDVAWYDVDSGGDWTGVMFGALTRIHAATQDIW